MKGILRSTPVAAVLGWLIWSYMALCSRTIRWTVEGANAAEASWPDHGSTILAAWHHQILLLPSVWIQMVRQWHAPRGRAAMLISLSADGEPVAKAIEHIGLESVRGSARDKRKNKDKGGREALKAALEILRSGGGVCLTPDGPRGPAERVAPGPAVMARRVSATTIPFAISARPAWRLKTWDRFMIPLPFTNGAMVFGAPILAERYEDADSLRRAIQTGMDHANSRAQAILAGVDSASQPAREA
ncbi:MAG: lysophospholipid acyltransferase family protein [Pseudomonadota bacterium]